MSGNRGGADVVLLGGTGASGQALLTLLRQDPSVSRVCLLSRRRPDTVPRGVEHVALDARSPGSVRETLEGAALLVDAAGLDDGGVVAGLAVGAGVHVVDLSADPAHLGALERLEPAARAAGVTVLTEVGLAPGLSNLLATHAHGLAPGADRVDVTLSLGLGDVHGTAGSRWVLEQLAGGVVTMPARSLRRSTGVPVTTGLVLEPRWLAAVTTAAARSPLPLPLLARTAPFVARLTRRDVWSLVARSGAAEVRAGGRGQGTATAVVAAWAVRRLLSGGATSGVVPLHDLATLDDVRPTLLAHEVALA